VTPAEEVTQALEDLEAALHAANHPLVTIGGLRPGLSRDDAHDLAAAAGVILPLDAERLWAWHDGMGAASNSQPWPPGGGDLPGGVHLLRLADAVDSHLHSCRTYPFTDLDEWRPHLFGAMNHGNGDTLYLDTLAPALGPTPVVQLLLKDMNLPEDVARRTIPSLAEAVVMMTELLRRGLWAPWPASGQWTLVRDPDPDLQLGWLL
jgi:hypothetical protein